MNWMLHEGKHNLLVPEPTRGSLGTRETQARRKNGIGKIAFSVCSRQPDQYGFITCLQHVGPPVAADVCALQCTLLTGVVAVVALGEALCIPVWRPPLGSRAHPLAPA